MKEGEKQVLEYLTEISAFLCESPMLVPGDIIGKIGFCLGYLKVKFGEENNK